MIAEPQTLQRINRRVRAIVLTGRESLLFIRRVKPNGQPPYWVAPGGGVEDTDHSLLDALYRELDEELGATVDVLDRAFVLKHIKAHKKLEEHFYLCRLRDYDLSQRHGPEFEDPSKGQYMPDEVPLDGIALAGINIKTPELTDWLIDNLDYLRDL